MRLVSSDHLDKGIVSPARGKSPRGWAAETSKTNQVLPRWQCACNGLLGPLLVWSEVHSVGQVLIGNQSFLFRPPTAYLEDCGLVVMTSLAKAKGEDVVGL